MVNYQRYIKSPDWYSIAARIRKRDGGCLRCGKSATKLHVHHGTYARLGKERDSDLFTLCAWCHDELHRVYAAERSRWPHLYIFTKWFIKKGEPKHRVVIVGHKGFTRTSRKGVPFLPAVVDKTSTFDDLFTRLRWSSVKPEPPPRPQPQPFVRKLTAKQKKHFEAVARRREKRRRKT